MSVIAVIPARGGSKRIPRKNLVDFCGKPLVAWSIEQALAAELVDRVIVSTDDTEIAEVSRSYGAEVVMRPLELAVDSSTVEESVLHALKGVDADVVVILQPTSPLRLEGDIDGCIELMRCGGFPVCLSATLEDDLYLWDIEPITFDRKTRKRHSLFSRENGSVYCIQKDVLFATRSRYGEEHIGVPMKQMQKWQSFEIDEPEDIAVCEALMKAFVLKEELCQQS